MLILKMVDAAWQTRDGFRWPREIGARVEAPDWSTDRKCGGGLHGWAEGKGDFLYSYPTRSEISPTGNPIYGRPGVTRWLIVDADPSDVVWIDGNKCKFRAGTIVLATGWRGKAVRHLIRAGALTVNDRPGYVCLTMHQVIWAAKRQMERRRWGEEERILLLQAITLPGDCGENDPAPEKLLDIGPDPDKYSDDFFMEKEVA